MSPPLVRLLPLANFNCTVMVDVELPSAVIDVGLAVNKLVVVDATPAVKLTVALSAIALPFNVPVIVDAPAMTELVSIAL